MKTIGFSKMVAAGNDFVVIDSSGAPQKLAEFAKEICDRKFGAGADGLLVRCPAKGADARMRIFNSDGSEAEMCGNGSRCFALYLSLIKKRRGEFRFRTKAGMIEAVVSREIVKVKLTAPGPMALDVPVPVMGRDLHVNSVNTGVPHAGVFVEGLKNIDVDGLGRAIRFHQKFAPAGTNVNFIEVTGSDSISIRTYERGVEGETLACGTGATASALLANAKYGIGAGSVSVRTTGGEVLKIYFVRRQDGYSDVWLEGTTRLVYKGDYHV